VLFHNTTGAGNTAIGYHALSNNTTGSSNIALGFSAGGNLTTGTNNIAIGSLGGVAESNTTRIGTAQTRAFIKGISGTAVTGATVVVNAAGQLGVAPSSAHLKHEIRPMNKASEPILELHPVSFCYDQDVDPQGLPQFGLVAEEVEKVNPGLVVHDEQGKPYTVRYDAVNAMLLNEFIKEHQRVKDLEAKVARLTDKLEEQDSKIDSVRDQVGINRPEHPVANR
jgi:hypothetical protein